MVRRWVFAVVLCCVLALAPMVLANGLRTRLSRQQPPSVSIRDAEPLVGDSETDTVVDHSDEAMDDEEADSETDSNSDSDSNEEADEEDQDSDSDSDSALIAVNERAQRRTGTGTRGEDGEEEEKKGDAKGGGDDIENCEVCTYMVANKEQHQSYLCRGLAVESQQKVCVQVLESLMWWVTNEVYWLNYGCQRTTDSGATEWVRPCPAHVVCGWLEDLNTRKPFCNPPDPQYPKPK